MKEKNAGKLEYVNAVRGLAILMVILLHVARAVKGLPDLFNYMSNRGAFGVQLFFVASAFTLFLSYYNRGDSEGEYTKKNFFIRRFFRISPMYYLAAIIYSIIFFYIPEYNDGKPLVLWKVLSNVFYINGFLPGAINYLPPGGWSVGVEMVFYCCVPFLYSKIKNFKSAVFLFLGMAIASVILKMTIRYILIQKGMDYKPIESWFLYFWVPNQAPVFILGIALFYAIKNFKVNNKWITYIGIFTSCLMLFIFTFFYNDIDPEFILPEHIIVALFFTLNIYFLSQHRVAIFDNAVTRYLGEISFSLYLIHFIVIYLLSDYFPMSSDSFIRYIELFLLTMIISIPLSKLTYYAVEVPGIKFGNRFIKRKILTHEHNSAN